MSAWHFLLTVVSWAIAWLAGACHGYRAREAVERGDPKSSARAPG